MAWISPNACTRPPNPWASFYGMGKCWLQGPVAKGKSASVPSASPPCKQGDALIFKAFSDFEGLFYGAHSQSWALLSEGLSAN